MQFEHHSVVWVPFCFVASGMACLGVKLEPSKDTRTMVGRQSSSGFPFEQAGPALLSRVRVCSSQGTSPLCFPVSGPAYLSH